jgi:hypothetical protein
MVIDNVKSVLLKRKPVFENYDFSTADIDNITRAKGIYSGLQ